MVTGPGILRRADEAGVPMADPAELFVPHPSPSIAQLRAQFDQAMLIVLVAATVSCEPQCIIVGGQVGHALAADTDRYREGLQAALRVAPEITVVALGDFSGAAGAVADGLQQSYRELGVSDDGVSGLPAGAALNLASVHEVMTFR